MRDAHDRDLQAQEPGLIVVASFVCVSMLTSGIKYFVYKSISEIGEYYQNLARSMHIAWWIRFAVRLVLFAAATFVQVSMTVQGIDRDT